MWLTNSVNSNNFCFISMLTNDFVFFNERALCVELYTKGISFLSEIIKF